MPLQDSGLTMTSLGLAAPDQIEAGVHLRWQMAADLGFPPHGFNLYRRVHLGGEPACADLPAEPGDLPAGFTSADLTITATIPLVSRTFGPADRPALVLDGAARMTITCPAAMRSFVVRAAHQQGVVRLVAFDGTVPVDGATLAAPGGNAILVADRFTRVEIVTEGATAFFALCRVLVVSGADNNWGAPLASLDLPPDWATAAARIPAALHERYEPSFPRLQEVIGLLPTGARAYAATDAAAPAPSFVVEPTSLLLLAALDPAIARILGLAYLDTTAALDTRYDYRVVGRWDPGDQDPQIDNHRWICFGVKRGTPPPAPAPTGLTARALAIGGGLVAAADPSDQVAAALTWDLRRAAGGPRAGVAVLYHLDRQRQGPDGWEPPTRLTDGRPLLVPASAATGDLPGDFYVDGPLPDGVYRYRVSGIDLFGRGGEPSAPVAIALADTVAPPPPIAVAARALPTDGRVDLHVTWRWSAGRRDQAADAASFRVYYQTEGIRGLPGTITAVVPLGDGASTVTTDLPAGGDYGRFAGGHLVNRGHRFPILSIGVAGASLALRLQHPIDADGQPIPPRAATPIAGRDALVFVDDPGALAGRFVLLANWSDPARWRRAEGEVPVTAAESYALGVSAVPLMTDPLIPVAYGIVGVTTVDRAGNEGPVSPPVTVAVAHAVAPATPAPASGVAYATRADYHGRSRYTLTIAPTEPGLYYEIYRALDATILAKAGQGTADDAALLALGDLWDEAFSRLDTRDAAGRPLTGTGGALTYTDTLPGTGDNRFVYRVRVVDRAGNRSPIGGGLVVHLIDVVPPRPPVVTGVTGGDRRVTLRWARNGEPDLALYRLHRASDPVAAADLRAMPLIASFILDPAAATAVDLAVDATASLDDDGAGQVRYTDAPVPGRADLFYRLVAVDRAGNASPPGPLIVARAADEARPDPPTWQLPLADAAGLVLRWRADDPDLDCLVQRRAPRAPGWSRLSAWLGRGASAYTDTSRVDGVVYAYRLTVRDAAGRTNTDYSVLEH